MIIKSLGPTDAEMYREIRFESLIQDPYKYYRSINEENKRSVHKYKKILEVRRKQDNFILGGFINQKLIGIAGFHRFEETNLRHKGYIYGLYIRDSFDKNDVFQSIIERLILEVEKVNGIEQIIATTVCTKEKVLFERMGFNCFAISPNSIKYENLYYDEYHLTFQILSKNHDYLRE